MENKFKEWKNADKQIELLSKKGMIIKDHDFAREYLLKIGYYRLSGYWHPFKEKDLSDERAECFTEGTTFQEVIDLYNFDRDLRFLVSDGLERIELYFQTRIAYLLGEKDPVAHIKKEFFNDNFTEKIMRGGKPEWLHWLDKYKTLKERSSKKKFVKHNIKEYGELPIWVAIEIFDFGSISTLYSGMKLEDKMKIQNDIGALETEKLFMDGLLRSFSFIRNVSAHHSRLWNIGIVNRSKKLKNNSISMLETNKLFYYICMMKIILDKIYPELKWGDNFKILMESFPSDGEKIRVGSMGMTENWEKDVADIFT